MTREPRNEEGTAARVSESPSTGEPNGEIGPQAEDARPSWVIERKHLQDELRKRVLKSNPQNPSVCVTPYPAAVYVTNMLTVHNPDLLADLALTFAPEQVAERLSDNGGTATPSTSKEGPEE